MKYKKSVFRSLAMVTQLGLSMMTPIFLCIFLGYQIDSLFGSSVMVVFLAIGVLAGVRCAYVLIKSVLKADEKERSQELLHQRELRKNQPVVHKPKQPSRIFRTASEKGRDEKEELY